MKKINPNVDQKIFKALENVNMNCILGWYKNGTNYSFLDDYDKRK